MGTRAAFFIGDFRDVEKREWLGCIAWDGYPEGLPEMCGAKSEDDFREIISKYQDDRDDFAKSDGPFPFPWNDDLCLTDETYCWHDGQIYCEMDYRFVPLAERQSVESDEDFEALRAKYPIEDCRNIPAPGGKYDGGAPDSIIVVSA